MQKTREETEQARPRSVRFGLNVLWNLLGQAGLILLSFFLVPYLVRRLGTEGYALYGMLGVLAGYLSLLTLGAGNATLKFVSEYLAQKNAKGLRDVLKISLLLHGGGVFLGAAAVFWLRAPLASGFFNISPPLQKEGVWIIGCAAISSVFFALTQLAVSIFQGMQSFGAANAVGMLQTGCVLGGSALLLYLGLGLKEIGVLYLVVHAALALAFLRASMNKLPAEAHWASGGIPDSQKARGFLSYSLQAFLVQLAWSVTFQWDKIFIAYFLPLSHLTYYLIPSFILQRFWILPSSVSTATFPLISELAGLQEETSLKKVYRQCGQLILWLMVPIFVVLFAFAPQLLTLWIGSDFSQKGTWPLRWLLGGYFFYLLAMMPNTAAFGKGRPQYVLAYQSLLAILCVLFWYIGIPKWGITGAALGFFLAHAATSLPYAWLISRVLFQMPFGEYLDGILLRPLASGGILLIFLWPLKAYAWSWISLAALGFSSAVFYYGLGFWFLAPEERETLKRLADAFRQRV